MRSGWSARARMSGPLVEFVAGFEAELLGRGYAPSSVAHRLRLMAGLDAWLVERGLDAAALSDELVERFVAPRREAAMHMRTARSLEPLLGYLREVGVAAPPVAEMPSSPVEVLLEQYRRYLISERGLTPRTAERYLRVAGPFAWSRATSDGMDLAGLRAADVTAFVVGACREKSGRAGRELVTVLRSLLRFCQLEGLTGGGLVEAVPSAASWRLAGLPLPLGPGQAQLLLDSCDRSTVAGRRDLAILSVLWRLGLRTGEAAAMALEDIDWRRGELTVLNGKRRRRELLPLPVDVGELIADYLQGGRPPSASTRCVFVRLQAPLVGLTGTGIGDVVKAACRRAGLPKQCSRRMRHTAATDMLRAGATLSEIGQVLRHRLASTTAIYAKVDIQRLAVLARPWPGGAS
jgi:integrase/recombinase XerD